MSTGQHGCSGRKDYADGATLADGVTSYIAGEQKLAEGAGSLGELGDGLTQVKAAISQLKEATDGEERRRKI